MRSSCLLAVIVAYRENPGIIPDLRRGIDGDSQISQNRMWYDEIECNRNKDRERVTYS